MKQFVCGLGGCGKRAVQKVLQRAGVCCGKGNFKNSIYDIPGIYPYCDKMLSGDRPKGFEEFIQKITGDDDFSLKTGQVAVVIPQVVKVYPDAQFVLMVRHVLDSICVERDYEGRWHSGKVYTDRFRPKEVKGALRDALFWRNVYSKAIHDLESGQNKFLIIRLEDLIKNTGPTLTKIFEFAEIDKPIKDYIPLIKKTPSAESVHEKKVIQIGEGFGRFTDTGRKEIIEATKELLKYFGYQ